MRQHRSAQADVLNRRTCESSARGEVYSVPAKKGLTYNLTQTPKGTNARPFGRPTANTWPTSPINRVNSKSTSNRKTDRNRPRHYQEADTYKPSASTGRPIARRFCGVDRKLRLNMVDVASGTETLLYQARFGTIGRYDWSPDSNGWCSTVPPRTAFRW